MVFCRFGFFCLTVPKISQSIISKVNTKTFLCSLLDFRVPERESPSGRSYLLSKMLCQYQKCLNDKINI